MGIFSFLKRRARAVEQNAQTVAQIAPEEPTHVRKPFSISETALALAGLQRTAPKRLTVFTMPKHPPTVGPRNKKLGMAMDSSLTAQQSWANQQVLASIYSEGLSFLGYAYLSELAQRPEYRVISETIAGEMTRKWIRFTARDDIDDDSKNETKKRADRIKELEKEFKRLNVRDIFCRATEQDGFFGRGHIYIDTDDTDDRPELEKSIGDGWDDISKLKVSKKKPIKALRTVEALWCYPTSYNSNDPLQDNWYRPDQWYVQSKIVHSSRLITFIGREVPDMLKPTYSFGGLSMSQMAKPYVDNWLNTRQSVADLIKSFTVYVLKTNLQETVQADGQQLFNRAALFTQTRTNQGLLMVDKESEDFANVSAPLSGLDLLQAQTQEHMASVAHTPVVKLFGIQPAGLNADSDGIMRAFYDYINAYQEHLYRDKIKRLMGLVMLSLWGETDDAIDFEFEPLWNLDDEALARVEKTKAETDQILTDVGAIDPEEVRKRVASDSASEYTSIDPDDVPDLLEEEESGLAPKGGHMLQGLGQQPTSQQQQSKQTRTQQPTPKPKNVAPKKEAA